MKAKSSFLCQCFGLQLYLIAGNGYKKAQFHIKGDLSHYTKDYIQDVKETVAAILGCKVEDIVVTSVRRSKSFLLVLSVKTVYIQKLLAMNEQDRLKLRRLNIDYLIIGKETIHLEKSKGKQDNFHFHRRIFVSFGKLHFILLRVSFIIQMHFFLFLIFKN